MLFSGAAFADTKSSQARKIKARIRALMPRSKKLLFFEVKIANKWRKNQLGKTCTSEHNCGKQTNLKSSATSIYQHGRNNSININKKTCANDKKAA